MAPETRDLFHWLSALIALPAVAYAGQPFFLSALRRAARRGASTWTCRSRSALSWRSACAWSRPCAAASTPISIGASMLLFFLLVRPLSRPAPCARRDPRGRRQSAGAEGRDRATVLDADGRRRVVPVAALRARRPSCWSRPGERVPPTASCSTARSEVDDSLITGETRCAASWRGRAGLCRHAEPRPARCTIEVARRRQRHAARRDRAADAQAVEQAQSRYRRLADRAARLYAPVVHAPRRSPRFLGWIARGRSPGTTALIIADRRADHHLPLRAGARGAGRAGGRRAAGCSAPACCSRPATRSSGSPRSTRWCSTRPAR